MFLTSRKKPLDMGRIEANGLEHLHSKELKQAMGWLLKKDCALMLYILADLGYSAAERRVVD